MSQSQPQPNNPLHGITLKQIVNELVEHFGWDELGAQVNIRSFNHDPSVKSSLKFLRKTPWAREKVEALYLEMLESAPAQKPAPPKDSAG
ncbi:MAG: hypothetical protein DRI32_08405 [Chloroflexi bacterium]|nr:MAG: hypothetical protein DRI32_08405 [Chloroflexota bacterium]